MNAWDASSFALIEAEEGEGSQENDSEQDPSLVYLIDAHDTLWRYLDALQKRNIVEAENYTNKSNSVMQNIKTYTTLGTGTHISSTIGSDTLNQTTKGVSVISTVSISIYENNQEIDTYHHTYILHMGDNGQRYIIEVL